LGSYSADLEIPANEVFSEIQQCIGTADYKVKTIIPNQIRDEKNKSKKTTS